LIGVHFKGSAMNPQLIVVLVGLFFILVVGGLSLLRREGLSTQIALEALVIIGLALGISAVTGIRVDPIVLFIVLYLVTMRSRLLTDLANLVAKRRGYATAERLYHLALRLHPDRSSRFIVLINWGTALLQGGDVERAITAFADVLEAASDRGGLGHKYEAACHYNLAVAYRRAGDNAKAVLQFNKVIDLFPASVYSQAAENALKKMRKPDVSENGS
jgi:tetratricopeptide (TPR) repeat protein